MIDIVLIFLSFLITSLILTIMLIKSTQILSRRRGSKVDQMVGEDMKWAERREVLEKRIIWESGRPGAGRDTKKKGMGRGRGVEAQIGWRELSERGRSVGKYK